VCRVGSPAFGFEPSQDAAAKRPAGTAQMARRLDRDARAAAAVLNRRRDRRGSRRWPRRRASHLARRASWSFSRPFNLVRLRPRTSRRPRTRELSGPGAGVRVWVCRPLPGAGPVGGALRVPADGVPRSVQGVHRRAAARRRRLAGRQPVAVAGKLSYDRPDRQRRLATALADAEAAQSRANRSHYAAILITSWTFSRPWKPTPICEP
jgi:hypothetical protein